MTLYGLAAEFETHEQLVRAAEQSYAHGFREMDAYAPFPVEGLAEALGKKNHIPLLVLLGESLARAVIFMEWFANVVKLSSQCWRTTAG